jgi:hypothetical protein
MVRGREEALKEYLGIDSPSSEYPQRFAIPEAIHELALEGLSRTVQDGHERSLHFRYRHNGWRGGIAVRGTKTSVNFLHTNSTLFWHPHVQVHTHPDISDEELRAAVVHSNITGLESQSQLIEVVAQALQLIHQVPSSADVFRTLHEPAGSVGHLLLSSYGSFAWVHRSVQATKGIMVNTFSPKYRQKTKFARDRELYVLKTDEETLVDITDLDEVGQKLKQTRAVALASIYVCYANDKPETPELIKVEV